MSTRLLCHCTKYRALTTTYVWVQAIPLTLQLSLLLSTVFNTPVHAPALQPVLSLLYCNTSDAHWGNACLMSIVCHMQFNFVVRSHKVQYDSSWLHTHTHTGHAWKMVLCFDTSFLCPDLECQQTNQIADSMLKVYALGPPLKPVPFS